ncbi:MAG: lysine--tRNA ligase [Nanoarchaeota archaeon]|jgi:lysyl-tRNA synthetase class 2|nr:lysine--tRNA ligase [Nanoarchaeota archaeon]
MELKGREKQIVEERIKKINELRESGVEPFPYSFKRSTNCSELQEKYKDLPAETITQDEVKIAGRLISKRDLGKISFAKLQDQDAYIQIVSQDGETDDEVRALFKKYVSAGDFVGITGLVMRSKRGELSILIKAVEVLTKAVYPMPDEHYGLKDKEERYRKRHLDLIMNQEVKNIFKTRSAIIKAVREFMDERGFMEVETPILQAQHGGASARPFLTHINAWDMPMYLSIAPELYLKRLIVGGFEKVYTICKNFRNEGVDHSHNPEFTMIEAYQAYADYNDMMKLIEECWEFVALKILGTTKIKRMVGGKEVEMDVKAPWPRKTTAEIIEEYTKINVNESSVEELIVFCKENKVELPANPGWGKCVEEILGEVVEHQVISPVHVYDRPKEGTPLCKRKRGDERLNEQCEPIGAGMELGNIYSELNDPIKQEEAFDEQNEQKAAGDDEAHEKDEDFLDALRQGMPPTGGIGWGIDRMVILMTGAESIRDIILFPTMKPEGMVEKKADKKKK